MKLKLLIALMSTLFSASILLAEDKSELKILYWNIQNGMWDGQTDNYNRFVDWVSSRDADICVWAEAQTIFLTGTSKKMNPEDRYLIGGWKKLARRYGHRYVYVGGHRDNYPQVITSRYPIKNALRMTDEVADSVVSHGAGWAKIKFKGNEINIVTVHTWPQKFSFEYNKSDNESKAKSASLNEGDKYRLKEMKYICEHTILSQPTSKSQSKDVSKSAHVSGLWIMAGDFNSISPIDNDVYKYPKDSSSFLLHKYILENTPYIDSVKKFSEDEFHWTTYQKLRYDYMYMSPDLDSHIVSIAVIRDEYTLPVENPGIRGFCHPSDHLPIEAVLLF